MALTALQVAGRLRKPKVLAPGKLRNCTTLPIGGDDNIVRALPESRREQDNDATASCGHGWTQALHGRAWRVIEEEQLQHRRPKRRGL